MSGTGGILPGDRRREPRGSVERSAAVHWWRWRGLAVLALAVAVALPAYAVHSYRQDQQLRRTGEVVAAEVTQVEQRQGVTFVTVTALGRQAQLVNPPGPAAVGNRIDVVVGQDGRVILADDSGAIDDALGPGLVWPGLLVAVILGLGWGPGLAPYRAVRAMRDPRARAAQRTMTIAALGDCRACQGRVYTAWRRGAGRFYDLDLTTGDGRILHWQGLAAKQPAAGSPVLLVGGDTPGTWAVVVAALPGVDGETVCWPTTVLSATGTAASGPG